MRYTTFGRRTGLRDSVRVLGTGRLSDWGRVVHTESHARKTAIVDAVIDIAAGGVRRP